MENKPQNNKSPIAEREEKILEFWKDNKIFEKSLKKKSPKGKFVFYEGPPTANGRPGIHHLESRAFKDAVPRYKTMQGFYVRRKAGWDTHGLPVEIQVEKELKLSSKKDIEKFGIANFNKKCKESVFKYVGDWDKFTERIGYFVDRKDAYFTFDNSYIESVWNIVKKVDDKKLLYKDYKVLPWCPRCGTALSSHELAQGYETVKDLSVYVKFKVKGQENTYLLAWTTTPWTLPGNVALAVGEKIDYVIVELLGGEEIWETESGRDITKIPLGKYIIAKEQWESVIKLNFGGAIEKELKGKDLVGLEYEPLYPFLKDNLPESEKAKLKNAFKVYSADFVTTTDGTGIVHTAIMYGQDDFVLGTKVNLPKYHLVKEDGHFKDECGFLKDLFVKDESTAVEIIKDLASRSVLFKKEKYEHTYPFCWRCKTPLIYYARDSVHKDV